MKISIDINELREKKIFVGTPMYGGMCLGMYTKASCDLATTATKYGMDRLSIKSRDKQKRFLRVTQR